MLRVSLLDRFSSDLPASRQTDRDLVLASIFGNLRRVLNTRRNACETRPDLGLSDSGPVGDMRFEAGRLAREVEAQIAAFEPRLRDVTVAFVPDGADGLRLSFRVSGRLVDDDAPVSFRSVLTGSGTFVLVSGGEE